MAQHRDYGNYKSQDDVVFSNRESIAPEKAAATIAASLEEGIYFKPGDLRLANLHFDDGDTPHDHEWHEFDGCDATTEPVNDPLHRDLGDIITTLSRLKQQGRYLSWPERLQSIVVNPRPAQTP